MRAAPSPQAGGFPAAAATRESGARPADGDMPGIRRLHLMPDILVIHRRNPLGATRRAVTASARGRDDRPATVESLPSHSPSESGSPSHQTEVRRATAGRLTKPPPCGSCGLALERMRKRQASSSARVPDLSGTGAERRANGRKSATLPGSRRGASRRAATGGTGLRPGSVGQDRASARELRKARPEGFGRTGKPNGEPPGLRP